MESFKNYLESHGKSKSTVKHYNTYVLDFLAWLDKDGTEPENATAKEVMAYMNILQNRGQEGKTRNIRLNVIRQFFNYQIELGYRTDNPVQHLKIKGGKRHKLYHILTPQELDGIYTSYTIPPEDDPRHTRNWFRSYRLSKQRNKAVLSLLVNQGLNTPEVERLTLNDLKLKEGLVEIKGSRRSNGRTLELKSSQIIELMEYTWKIRPMLLEYQKEEIDQLFLPVPVAGRKTANASLQIWKGLTREIKPNQRQFINFKQVRTSVITHWLKHHNLRKVQYMAGHRYVSSTEAYLVNHVEDLKADIDKFHPV